MFSAARLKLTGWYILIIMVIVGLFSMAIYQGLAQELERFSQIEQARFHRQMTQDVVIPIEIRNRFPVSPFRDPELVNEAKMRIATILLILDGVILCVAGGLSYFLAGQTLKPIREMVEEQNRFITDASHELRTPLTALKSSIEVHLRDKKLSLKEAKALLHSNLEEVNQLQLLSDALLRLAQYENRQKIAVKEIVQLDKVALEAQKKVHSFLVSKHIQLTQQLLPVEVQGDRTALCEVFVILLDNAIKYSSNDSSILMKMEKIDHNVRVTVTDYGVGIDSIDLPHIFERFYRAEKSRSKEVVQGYGLGLSIAQTIVQQHGGSLTATSQPGKGSTFTLHLPLLMES